MQLLVELAEDEEVGSDEVGLVVCEACVLDGWSDGS